MDNMSLYDQFPRKTGLWVTDFTDADWCEKQMEFSLKFGKPECTQAMKAGSARHAQLEESSGAVKKGVKIPYPLEETTEDGHATKCLKFIIGANQLLCDGLTRELPVVGFARGVPIAGRIDEIHLSSNGVLLVDTKTRGEHRLPREAQRRKGRLQLMIYKYLYDTSIVAKTIASKQLLDYLGLNPNLPLSKEIRELTAECGFPSKTKTLHDIMPHVRHARSMLPRAEDELMLRYEFQKEYSLLGEAKCTPAKERWKCKSCDFASHCHVKYSMFN